MLIFKKELNEYKGLQIVGKRGEEKVRPELSLNMWKNIRMIGIKRGWVLCSKDLGGKRRERWHFPPKE